MFELGNSLRDVRVRQGLDHAEVEQATKIRAKYIRAIEDEQFGILPAQTYVKGFLRSYADFLGLDGQVYVDEYDSRFLTEGFDDAPRRRPSRAQRERRGVERRMVLLALAGVAALAALVIGAWKFGGGSPSASTPPGVQNQTAAPGLALRGVGAGTYIEVRKNSGGGAIVFQGTLRTGEREFVPGAAFWILLRHPQGARLQLDGKPVSLPAIRNLKVLVGRDYITRVHG
jgi:cytoskeleton protein RodZ